MTAARTYGRQDGAPATQAPESGAPRRARLFLLRAALIGAAFGLSAAAEAQDLETGRRIFTDVCSTCHGQDGQQKALGRSVRLNTLDAATARAALKTRQEMADPTTMQDRIKSALSDEEAQSVSLYVGELTKARALQ